MNLTEWYPPHIKPVRKGVYITRKKGMIFFQHWTGKFWNTRMGTIDSADLIKFRSIHQDVEWKGIKK